MQEWKRGFSERLRYVQTHWVKQFESALDSHVAPVFDDLGNFLRNQGFSTSVPLREQGRRSFKFELAENAYLLLIFKATAIGEFELRREAFAPGRDPQLSKSVERVGDLKDGWAVEQFQAALDAFLEHLGGQAAPVEAELAVA